MSSIAGRVRERAGALPAVRGGGANARPKDWRQHKNGMINLSSQVFITGDRFLTRPHPISMVRAALRGRETGSSTARRWRQDGR